MWLLVEGRLKYNHNEAKQTDKKIKESQKNKK